VCPVIEARIRLDVVGFELKQKDWIDIRIYLIDYCKLNLQKLDEIISVFLGSIIITVNLVAY
jgi:hypothetical protein